MRRATLCVLGAALLMISASPTSVSAGALPTDTDPLGTLSALPAGTNESPTAGATRLVVVFTDDNEAARGFGVKLSGLVVTATGPSLPALVGQSAALEDVREASGGVFPEPLNGAFAGFHGDAADGNCPASGGRPQLWAYSVTRTETTTGVPYAVQPCEEVDEVVAIPDPDGGPTTYETTVTEWTPGFWIDVAGLPTAAWTAGLIQYGAVFDTEGESGDFYETADSAGTSTYVDATP